MKIMNKNTELFAFLRLFLFSTLFFVSLVGLDRLLFASNNVHPVWKYVSNQKHEPIDVLFIGNSHTYTTIDAGMVSHATGLNVRSLTCPSINGEIVAADLEALLNYEVPKVVIAEICPFTAANFEIMRNESVGLVLEHFDGIPDIPVRWKAVSKITGLENVPSGVFQLLRNTMMWSRWTHNNTPRMGYDEYGANRLYGVGYDINYSPEELQLLYSSLAEKDNAGMASQNQNSFQKIMELAEKYGFDLWIYNAPIGIYDQNYKDALLYISMQQKTHSCVRYMDNSMLNLSEIGIDKTDFYDVNHLNANGMEKTSIWIGKKIADRFHADFQTDSILNYKDTKITMLENGLYRYTFHTFTPGQYRFVYKINGEQVDTGYKDQNWIEECAISLDEITGFKIYVQSDNDAALDGETVGYQFLQYTIEEYSAVIRDDCSIEIKNRSNFSDDLVFAWKVTDSDCVTVDEYEYGHANTVNLSFDKTGKYTIHACIQQSTTGVSRLSEIMTVSYDAENNNLSIDSMCDCMAVE